MRPSYPYARPHGQGSAARGSVSSAIRPGGRGTYARPEEPAARPPVKPRLPAAATPRPKGPAGPQPPSVPPEPIVPKALGTDVGMKRKLDQVSGGVILPSAKAISTGNAAGKGAAKGGSTTAQPEIGKGASKGSGDDAWATKKTMVLTPKAKPAPAEARETTPTGGATGGKGPAKFQPAPKSKLFQPPEPATEPPNGKGSKGAAKGAAKGKEATPVQKAVVSPQKGTQKGGQKGAEPKGKAPEKGKTDGGKGQPAQPAQPAQPVQPVQAAQAVQKGKSKGKEVPREPSTPPPTQAQAQPVAVVSGRMKNLEFSAKKVIQEWSTLPEDQKSHAMQLILDRIIEVLTPEQQRYAMDKLTAAGTQNGEEPEAEEQHEEQHDEPMETAEVNGNHEPSAEYKAMDEFIAKCEGSSQDSWSKAWRELQIPRQAEMEMLTLLFEVAVNKDVANKDTGFFDLVPRIVTDLVKSRQVFSKNVELALKEISRRMEELAQVNDQAWHLLSSMMLYLHPKGRGTEWGLQFAPWSWEIWWKQTKEVLGAAQKYRAFDILVLLLQMIQEKSEQVLKSLPAWNEPAKTAKVKEVLCQWGDMDEAAILETISAYGVDL